MFKRATLHKSKLEDFKSFLIENQIQFRDGKGEFQVLQVEVKDRFYPIYDRLQGDHLTTQRELAPLVKRYIASKKN
ncbi:MULTISPECIES: hypothetical protein [unclassified Acinetobacter]|uniref:hypothetical protein n=1 Tax=unclassified Acinetobacter TaxID=196816 RepID=UPI001F4AA0C7|nr:MULTISPECIES: hypothetical protein [unclassified Acinetobacter]MCH7353313.1 hypothetical protein [Acinetobacter sp. NIPH 2023]MCH7360695.1 hypothetical protein [Acinetobacter sp. NIPH 2024]